MATLQIITIFIILTRFPTLQGAAEPQIYENCSSLISCGKLQNIGYPFWGLGRPSCCGHPGLRLYCPSNQTNHYPFLKFGNDEVYHYVHGVQTSNKITIQLREFSQTNQSCRSHKSYKIFRETLPFSDRVVKMSLFYNCSGNYTPKSSHSITCWDEDEHANIAAHYIPQPDEHQYVNCSFFEVPVFSDELNPLNQGSEKLSVVLKQGYEVNYQYSAVCNLCLHSGGICGSSNDNEFVCFQKHHKSGHWKLIIGLVIPGAFFILIALNVGFCCCLKPKFQLPTLLLKKLSFYPTNPDTATGSTFYGIPIFSYSELQEATDDFKETRELGHGGFGIVYYGKLQDGREVAVKRLYEKNYKQIGQFTNEIEILTRLNHHNLVKLYGCTSRYSRELLLVYEYISNGTVADHLHGNRTGSEITLTWEMRMKIALESASALSYLHASDFIHRDVKTNNILLDNNFSVKVADFGLSRFFPFDATHISTAPQGTPGYLDPGYNKCYQVTSKSDVYSFGVVLVELISSLPAVDISRHEDEINLSDYAMNRIQHGTLDELVDHKLGFESDMKVKKMITLVAELAFRCLQQDKELRPSMDEVLENLKHIENIESEEMGLGNGIATSTETKKNSENNPPSPLSVMGNWNSQSTASNTSGYSVEQV